MVPGTKQNKGFTLITEYRLFTLYQALLQTLTMHQFI